MGRNREQNTRVRPISVVVIVEGYCDELVLHAPLTEAFKAKYGPNTQVLFTRYCNDPLRERRHGYDNQNYWGGDMTATSGIHPGNINTLLSKCAIQPVIEASSGVYLRDVAEVIHIIDTDGAYIPDEQVVLVEPLRRLSHPIYRDNSIETDAPVMLRQRNANKRGNIAALLNYQRDGLDIMLLHRGQKRQRTVPYSLFYFSCNLEHITINQRNVALEKLRLAHEFRSLFSDSLEKFLSFLKNDDAAIKDMSLEESWELLKEGSNSLKRLTNIGLLFKRLLGDNVFD